MSADPCAEKEGAPTAILADALYFDSGEHRLFGWHHRPSAGKATNIGLVICKPFGYEAICAHQSLRAFAEAAAELGVSTLRFDCAGTGDSSDIDPQADQLEVWTTDAIAAIAELRRLAGVERVYLLGFRLGALVATLAAVRCKTVSGLILVSPIISGQRYLRELRTMRLASRLGSGAMTSDHASKKFAAGAYDSYLEVSGFVLSAATIAALTQVDLNAPGMMSPTDMLIIDGTSLRGTRPWADTLSGLGAQVTYLALPGLIEMAMTAPQFATIPQAMISAMCDWLTPLRNRSLGESESGREQHVDVAMAPPITVLSLAPDGTDLDAPITERPVFLTSQAALFGIVTEPASGQTVRGAVILINAGADYHIGASGVYVRLARRWGRCGYLVLRMDLAGLGDSATRAGRRGNEVFPPAAVGDIRVAVDWMRTQYGVRDIALGGVCSGAYHALRAAVAAVAVNRVLMINPEVFFWNESMSIHGIQVGELVKKRIGRERIFSASALKRLLRGQVNIRYMLTIYARRLLLGLDSKFRDIARRLHFRFPNDLGSQLEAIDARGVRLVFVFSSGEHGIALLNMQAGISLKRLGERCRMHIIDGADHVFSKLESRMVLEKILSDELFAPIGASISFRSEFR
jgi:pimeloyl-ACP methyl ester carboxylesterase